MIQQAIRQQRDNTTSGSAGGQDVAALAAGLMQQIHTTGSLAAGGRGGVAGLATGTAATTTAGGAAAAAITAAAKPPPHPLLRPRPQWRRWRPRQWRRHRHQRQRGVRGIERGAATIARSCSGRSRYAARPAPCSSIQCSAVQCWPLLRAVCRQGVTRSAHSRVAGCARWVVCAARTQEPAADEEGLMSHPRPPPTTAAG
jgi:hypothetical protein